MKKMQEPGLQCQTVSVLTQVLCRLLGDDYSS